MSDGTEFALILYREMKMEGGKRMQFIDMHCDTLLAVFCDLFDLRKGGKRREYHIESL